MSDATFDRYVSVCLEPGITCPKARKVLLKDALRQFLEFPVKSNDKSYNYLFFNGYRDDAFVYPRSVEGLSKMSVMLVDCDNPLMDPGLLDAFKAKMSVFQYMTYETFSSSKQWPRFRAIIPLDREIAFTPFIKQAQAELFKEFADDKATWFHAPCASKVHTFFANKGHMLFNGQKLENEASRLEHLSLFKSIDRNLKRRRYADSNGNLDWHNVPKVIEHLTSVKGNRNDSAIRAACAMFSLGFSEQDVRLMLREGPLPQSEQHSVFTSAKRYHSIDKWR